MAICLKAIDYERMTSGDFQSDEGKEAIAGACHEMKHALDIISGTVGNPAFAQGMAKLDTIITTELNAWLSEAKSYFYSRGVDPVVRGWLEFNPNRWDDRNQIWSRLKNYTFMVFEQLDIPSDDLENRWSHFRDRLYGPSGSLTPKILIRKENFEMFWPTVSIQIIIDVLSQMTSYKPRSASYYTKQGNALALKYYAFSNANYCD
jgi:hypothetical protein